jgi:hypothetical protein
MASEFAMPGDGKLKMPEVIPDDSEDLPVELDGGSIPGMHATFRLLERGYWNCDRMLERLETLAIPLFEKRYPNYQKVRRGSIPGMHRTFKGFA